MWTAQLSFGAAVAQFVLLNQRCLCDWHDQPANQHSIRSPRRSETIQKKNTNINAIRKQFTSTQIQPTNSNNNSNININNKSRQNGKMKKIPKINCLAPEIIIDLRRFDEFMHKKQSVYILFVGPMHLLFVCVLRFVAAQISAVAKQNIHANKTTTTTKMAET